MSSVEEWESRADKAHQILVIGLDRHRDKTTGAMCTCGGCIAMKHAILAIKGKEPNREGATKETP